MFDGVNDSADDARLLVKALNGLSCRVNLIRFHAIPDSPLKPVPESRMVEFRDWLTAHGVFATIRASRGEDIWAACGMLSTAKNNKSVTI
jgi:23S rRNA (adenine2503-C2)-methyltransferase